MNCGNVCDQADLYLYGELPGAEEEEFEQHLHACSACRTELDRRKAVHRGLDRLRLTPEPALLAECRRDLFEAKPPANRTAPWGLFEKWPSWFITWRQPAGALALLALGFFSSRLTTRDANPGANLASMAGEPIVSTIRSVQPDASGQVRIALDETRRRMITGSLSDGNIERLMLAAARDEDNDGLRVESMELLKGRAGSVEVRDALLTALRNDPNPGVRFKALDALKGMAAQPEVRKTLTYVLQNDLNPGVRIQAIDLLTEHQDAGLVGMLQKVVGKESNSYVRQRCEKALEEMNASVGTF
jgi:hypothetical protein